MWAEWIQKILGLKKSKKEPIEFEEGTDISKPKPQTTNWWEGAFSGTEAYKKYKTGQSLGRTLGLWK